MCQDSMSQLLETGRGAGGRRLPLPAPWHASERKLFSSRARPPVASLVLRRHALEPLMEFRRRSSLRCRHCPAMGPCPCASAPPRRCIVLLPALHLHHLCPTPCCIVPSMPVLPRHQRSALPLFCVVLLMLGLPRLHRFALPGCCAALLLYLS